MDRKTQYCKMLVLPNLIHRFSSISVKFQCYLWISINWLIFYCFSSTVIPTFPLQFPPAPSLPTSHPWSYPLWLCPSVLYSCSWKPFPYFPPLSFSPLPLVIVCFFFISKSLVIFCLLFSSIDYVPVKGEIIWYLSLTLWFIALSIMLSRSIHAAAKFCCRSSFFLSAS